MRGGLFLAATSTAWDTSPDADEVDADTALATPASVCSDAPGPAKKPAAPRLGG